MDRVRSIWACFNCRWTTKSHLPDQCVSYIAYCSWRAYVG